MASAQAAASLSTPIPGALSTGRPRVSNVPSLRNGRRVSVLVPKFKSDFFSQSISYKPQSCCSRVVCSLSGASGGQFQDDEDPYVVFGVNPLQGFEAANAAYKRKTKDAERRGDVEALERLERAYDKLMMRQLNMRQKGVTFGSISVSKDIKYADRPELFPWRPRVAKVSRNDLLINLGVTLALSLWLIAKRSAEYKPLQFLTFFFVIRIFLKLQSFLPATDDSEKKIKNNSWRLLRTLGLVFGCVAVASIVNYGIVKGSIALLGAYPLFLATGQELIITLFSAVSLFVIGTFYR